jgi:hypothetical protein
MAFFIGSVIGNRQTPCDATIQAKPINIPFPKNSANISKRNDMVRDERNLKLYAETDFAQKHVAN